VKTAANQKLEITEGVYTDFCDNKHIYQEIEDLSKKSVSSFVLIGRELLASDAFHLPEVRRG